MKNLLFGSIACLCIQITLATQNPKNDPYILHKALVDSLKQQTSKESSFNRNIDTYLSQKELVSKIKGHPEYVLENYYRWGYWFHIEKIYTESNKIFQAYFDYYYANQSQLDSSFQKGNLHLRSLMYRIMAFNCYYLNDPKDSVEHYFYKSIDLVKDKDAYYYAAAVNDFAFYLMKKGYIDKALTLYNKALAILRQQNNDGELIGNVRDNIADIYLEQERYLGALELYEANFEFYQIPRAYHMWPSKINEGCFVSAATQVISTLLKLERPQKAASILEQTKKIISDKKINLKSYPFRYMQFIEAEQAFWEYRGDYHRALQKTVERNAIQDSLYQVKKSNMDEFEKRRSKYALQRSTRLFKLNKEIAEEKIRILLYERLLLVIVAFLFTVIIILLYKRYTRTKILSEAMRRELTYFSKQMQKQARAQVQNNDLPDEKLKEEYTKYGLSKREIQVMEVFDGKKTNADIASELYISSNTVKFHLKNIYNKLDITCREELYDKMKYKSDKKK